MQVISEQPGHTMGTTSGYSWGNAQEPTSDSSSADASRQAPAKKHRVLLAAILIGAVALVCVSTVVLNGKTLTVREMARDTTLQANSGAAEYTDLGLGKCTLADGSDPTHKWFGSGDVKSICDADDACLAYSKSIYGGGLTWYSEPLQGGGPEWGGCHCNVKKKSSLPVANVAKYADFGSGKCTLPDGSDPKYKWFGSGDVKSICDADETCLAYSKSMYGGGLTWYSGPLQGHGQEWGGCHCNVKEESSLAVDDHFILVSEGRGCGPGSVLAEPHVFKMMWQRDGETEVMTGFVQCQTDCKANDACKYFVYDKSTTFCGHYSACPVAGQPGTTFEKYFMFSVRGASTPSLDEPEVAVVDTPGQQDAVVELEPVLPPGAFIGDATPYPNIHLVTLGYNLFYGDPLPLLPANADPNKLLMDPGLRKPLFNLSYDDQRLTGDRRHTQPDGYHATVDLGCSTSFTTKKIRDLHEYQTEQSQTASVGARMEAALVFPPVGKKKQKKGKASKLPKPGVTAKAFARVGGTMSYQTKDIQSNKRLRETTMYSSNAKCSSYVVGLNFAKPPATHPELQGAVDALQDDSSAYYSLFDTFGTHMLTTVKMGGRSAANMFVDNTKVNEMRGTANGFGVSVEASVGAVAKVSLTGGKKKSVGAKVAKKAAAKVNLLSPSLKSAATDMERLLKRKTKSIVGPQMPDEGVDAWQDEVIARPVPMAFDFEPICQHPAITENADTYEKCEIFIETYCDEHLKPLGATCTAPSEKGCFTDLDCKDGFVCREFECAEVPVCEVTIYQNNNRGGQKYTFDKVNDLEHFGGKLVDLRNGDWWDKISSIELSKGCSRVEAIDNDGSCVLGKGDNRVYWPPGTSSLPWDLDNDVCKIKIFARKVPDSALPTKDRPGWIDTSELTTTQSSTLSGAVGSRATDGASDGQWGSRSCTHTNRDRNPWWEMDMKTNYIVKTVKIANRADCCGDRLNPFDVTVDGKICARSQSLPEGAYEEVQCDDPPTGRKLKIQVQKDTFLTLCEVEVYAQVPSRRLRANPEVVFNASSVPEISMSEKDVLYAESFEVPRASVRKLADYDSYLPNIGKANYGYNHWIAAPASAEYAGSDPGFARRPIFATSYDRGASVEVKEMNDLPYMSEKTNGRRLHANENSVPLVHGRRISSADLKAPDGWKVTKAERAVCQTEYLSKEVKSAYEYEAEMTDTFNPLLGRIDIGSVSFSYSSEESQFSQANAQFKKSMTKTGAECFDYQVELDTANPPATSDNFEFVVDAVNTETEYYRLFDLYGLDYATRMNFGARYGLTQTITEKSYRTMIESSSKDKVSVEYTIGIPKIAKKTGVAGGITVSASYETKKSEKEISEQSEFFQDRKEFSVGQRVPAEGGVEAWVDAANEEPMPIRYTFASICTHPVFADKGKKNDCETYRKTYCKKHLTKMKEGHSCDPVPKRECLWDMDCPDQHECTTEGSCVSLPDCYVTWGSNKRGPVYYRDVPMGETFEIKGSKINIVKVSKGCAEVIFYDEDKCKDDYEDNVVAELRNKNADVDVNLPWDLENDVCKMKLIPKEKWA